MTESLVQNSDPLSQSEKCASADSRRMLMFHCAFFAALVYVAHFWYSRRYSIYEDDFAIVPHAACWSFAQVLSWLRIHWAGFTHGRPIGWSTWLLIPYIGFKFGTLHAVYVVASTIVMANVVLFYLLLRRSFGQSMALIGGLAYCLFPADTTRQLLVHTTMLQPAVLIMLIASHCYMSKRYVAAYILGFATLLAYEVAFLPFLFVPLLVTEWNWKTLRRQIVHGLICTGIIAILIGLRLHFGEARMVEASAGGSSLVYRIVSSLCIGPRASLAEFYFRVFDPFKVENRGFHLLLPMILAFVAFLALLLASPIALWKSASARVQLMELQRPFAAGVAMLVASYLLAFTSDHYPPVAIAGRMSGIHLGAALGASILLAVVFQVVLIVLNAARLIAAGPILLASYFATLVGFAFIVQKNFVLAHAAQRTYFSRVVALCPDLEDGTLIMLEGHIPAGNAYALPRSWSDGLALMEMYDYPSTLRARPMLLHVLDRSWTADMKWQGDQLLYSRSLPDYDARPTGLPLHYVGRSPELPLTEDNLIVLRYADGKIGRIAGDIIVQGRPFHLKPAPTGDGLPFPSGILYPLLVDEDQLPASMRQGHQSGPFTGVR